MLVFVVSLTVMPKSVKLSTTLWYSRNSWRCLAPLQLWLSAQTVLFCTCVLLIWHAFCKRAFCQTGSLSIVGCSSALWFSTQSRMVASRAHSSSALLSAGESSGVLRTQTSEPIIVLRNGMFLSDRQSSSRMSMTGETVLLKTTGNIVVVLVLQREKTLLH